MAKDPKTNLKPVQIQPEVNEKLDSYLEKNFRLKRGTVSAVLKWFLDQEEPVQSVVLGVPSGMENAFANALIAMAEKLLSASSPTDSKPSPLHPLVEAARQQHERQKHKPPKKSGDGGKAAG